MSHFLLVVDIPPLKGSTVGMTESPEWRAFSSAVDTILKSAKIGTRPQKNCWLLNAENSWPVLMDLVHHARTHNLAYSVFLIDNITELSAKPTSGFMPTPAHVRNLGEPES